MPLPTLSAPQLKAWVERVFWKRLTTWGPNSGAEILNALLQKTTFPSSGSLNTPSALESLVTGTATPSSSTQTVTVAAASDSGVVMSVHNAHSPVTWMIRSVGVEFLNVALSSVTCTLELGTIPLWVCITSTVEDDTLTLSAG